VLGADERLEFVRAAPDPRPLAEARAVGRALLRVARQTRTLPLIGQLKVWEPGRGNHLGGSFPMAAHPRGLQSDLLGRPAGLDRVHVVDASVLPTIPATTVTLSVMANAHRIGHGAAAGG
jgi:choline dehydrogenase-like flavoprotein